MYSLIPEKPLRLEFDPPAADYETVQKGGGQTNKTLNIEYRTRNIECRSVDSLRSVFLNIKNDRIPYFDIHYSLFDILRFRKLLIKTTITMVTVSSVCKKQRSTGSR